MDERPANRRIWLVGLLLIPVLAVAAWPVKPACHEHYRTDRRLSINGSSLSAQVANTDTSREQGLSGRTCLATGQAMLFTFDKPGYYPFWMRDMRFPIDIIWIGNDHTVADVMEDAQPDSYPKSYINERPARYVLEVSAGSARKLGIGLGTVIKF